MNIKAKSRVQITIEMDTDSPWGEECNIGQLYKQSKNETLEKLCSKLTQAGLNFRLIGEPKVIGIITESI